MTKQTPRVNTDIHPGEEGRMHNINLASDMADAEKPQQDNAHILGNMIKESLEREEYLRQNKKDVDRGLAIDESMPLDHHGHRVQGESNYRVNLSLAKDQALNNARYDGEKAERSYKASHPEEFA